MAREIKPIDITNTPEVLRLAEEVARSGIPHVLKRDNKDLAVITPVSSTPTSRRRTPKTKADYEAFLSSFGSWKDFDSERFRRDREASGKLTRPPVELDI